MSFYVARLARPYDYRALIEAYIYTQRKDFIHADFAVYYSSLLEALQQQFGIRMKHEALGFREKAFWMLFQGSVRSLLCIANPWAGFLETSLLNSKLNEISELGRIVDRASGTISEANKASEAAHREVLDVLFRAIFGDCQRIVTSQDLLAAGFDDSREPDIVNYYGEMSQEPCKSD